MLIKTREFKVTAAALMFDPQLYLFDFAPEQQLSRFLLVDESALNLSPFIDIRFEPLSKAQFWVNTRELFAMEGGHQVQRAQPVYIFHHAFVCSTLLARCLNQIDAFFSLKEPWILRRLSDFKRTQKRIVSGKQWREMLCKNIMMLSRNYQSGRIPVIKATNVANNLMHDVLRFMPQQKMLYLYSDLESFLISNLKKTDETKQKMPSLALQFLSDGNFAQHYPQFADPSKLSFLQICALIWLLNLYNLKQTVERHDPSQLRTLDAKTLLEDMPGTLSSLSEFFGHQASPSEIQSMTDPQVTQTNAKDQSKSFGNEQRAVETGQIKNRYIGELENALQWAQPVENELGLLGFMQSLRLQK